MAKPSPTLQARQDANGERPFAVFDIDGTIIRWQLYHAIADTLAKTGHIDAGLFEQAKRARMQWKKRADSDAFKDYEHKLVTIYDQALKTFTADDFMQAVRTVFDEYKDQTYTYTRDLIRSLQGQNYLLFAISASQQEVVEMLAKYYGFDAWAGSVYAKKDDKFTGQKIPLRSELKVKALQGFIKQFQATHDQSIAVGDSDSDIPMLESVAQPIAFNPDKTLFRHAQQHKWNIVVERKSMVYQLESNNGSYLLA